MNPLLLLAVVGVGAWALAGKKSTTTVNAAASEVPADANAMLATVLAPSMVDVNVLRQAYAAFMAAAENQAHPAPLELTNLPSGAARVNTGDMKAAYRLAQYALATFLKAAMLTKGAQPSPDELTMIAFSPTGGGAGLIGYGDIGVDVQSAAATALADSYTDAMGLGTYIGALAQQYNTTAAGPARKRLLAFILALKAKQTALLNAPQFPEANQIDSPVYFAIANLPAGSIPAVMPPNSIVAY